jgi:hypothetical protein
MNNKATILPFLLERIHDKNPDEVIVFNLIEQAMLDHLVLVLVNNTRKLNAIKDELADVSIFLLRLAQILKIDISQAVREKLLDNEKRNLEGPNFSN